MLDYHAALAQLLDSHKCSQTVEILPLSAAANRILAEPLSARYPSPMFDNSAMDGYAVCDPEGRLNTFAVVSRTQAGEAPAAALQAGETVRIFTGAPVPAGATAVVMQENAEFSDGLLHIGKPTEAGANIRYRAEEIEAGQMLLPQGTRLSAAALGLAASQGYAELPVFKPLKATVFSSGNELAEPGKPLSDGHIYDANRYQLLAWLAAQGIETADGGILPDDLAATETALADAARRSDIIITSGGASVGEADWLKQAVENLGTLAVHTLAVKPGKPFGWGHIGAANVFVLPGNPVAAFVTAQILLLPVLAKLSGKAAPYALPQITARAAFSTRKAIKRREFLRVTYRTSDDGATMAELLPNQGSAMLATCTAATALCEIPAGETVSEGGRVLLHLLP
ncbi:gephyrin-like molybdotransferase Glp [Neisseria sp.]|uniref:molybdopterin molybdotransferase MoeA n=1 Tax=Neisseria sp. TaxID=192066 RepID=UPI0035A18FDC